MSEQLIQGPVGSMVERSEIIRGLRWAVVPIRRHLTPGGLHRTSKSQYVWLDGKLSVIIPEPYTRLG